MSVGALFDLGDVIQHTEGLAEDASVSCVMRYVWKYYGGYQMEGVGKNPALASAKSKTDKQIQGLASTARNKGSKGVSLPAECFRAAFRDA